MSVENKPFFVILSKEEIKIIGKALNQLETINIQQGLEN
jgi:hypothetical protein